MTTKDQVLNLLNKKKGSFLSGQEIADSIYVTRAAVWKAIKALEKDGYEIEAVTNKGYRIKKNIDTINISYIQKAISSNWNKTKILYFDEIDSTNDEAKRQALDTKNDFIIIADHQTNGHGRRGRDFYSPSNTGLYFSILLHRNNINTIEGITAIAASAVAKAIDIVIFDGEDATKIKWVNDIFYNNKKVAGILTEACSYYEDEEANYLIIGFGINVFEPEEGFPTNIKKTAGYIISNDDADKYLDNKESVRSMLLAAIANNLISFSKEKNECLKFYRRKSNLIGSYIKINNFTGKNIKDYAKVTGITSKYHLQIEYENGKKDELSSGEVSVVKY